MPSVDKSFKNNIPDERKERRNSVRSFPWREGGLRDRRLPKSIKLTKNDDNKYYGESLRSSLSKWAAICKRREREREGQTKTEEDEEMFLHNEKVGPFIKITSLWNTSLSLPQLLSLIHNQLTLSSVSIGIFFLINL